MRFNSPIYYSLLMLATTSQVLAEDLGIRNQGELMQIPIEQLVTMDVQSATKIASQISIAPSRNGKQVVISQNGRSYWLRMIYDFK